MMTIVFNYATIKVQKNKDGFGHEFDRRKECISTWQASKTFKLRQSRHFRGMKENHFDKGTCTS